MISLSDQIAKRRTWSHHFPLTNLPTNPPSSGTSSDRSLVHLTFHPLSLPLRIYSWNRYVQLKDCKATNGAISTSLVFYIKALYSSTRHDDSSQLIHLHFSCARITSNGSILPQISLPFLTEPWTGLSLNLYFHEHFERNRQTTFLYAFFVL